MVKRKARKTYPRVQALICEKLKTMSQEKLAKETGLTKDTVHRYSRGEGIPGEKNLKRLSDYFKVPVPWLMGEDRSLESETVLLIKECGMDFRRFELTKIEMLIWVFFENFEEFITKPAHVYFVMKIITFLKYATIFGVAKHYNKGHFEDVLGQAIALDKKLKEVFEPEGNPPPSSPSEQKTAKVTPDTKRQGEQPPDPET